MRPQAEMGRHGRVQIETNTNVPKTTPLIGCIISLALSASFDSFRRFGFSAIYKY